MTFCGRTHITFRGLFKRYTKHIDVQHIKNLIINTGVDRPDRGQYHLEIDPDDENALHFHDEYLGFLKKLMNRLGMDFNNGFGIVQKSNTKLHPYPANEKNEKDYTILVGLEKHTKLFVYKPGFLGNKPEIISYTNGDVIIANESLISSYGYYETHHLHEVFFPTPIPLVPEVSQASAIATSSSSADHSFRVDDDMENVD